MTEIAVLPPAKQGRMELTRREKLWLKYYCTPGTPEFLHSYKSAKAAGYVNDRQSGADCAKRLAPFIKEALQGTGYLLDEVIASLTEIARDSHIGNVMTIDEFGARVDWDKIAEDGMARYITEATPTEHGWRVKMQDRQAALNSLLRLYTAHGDINVTQINNTQVNNYDTMTEEQRALEVDRLLQIARERKALAEAQAGTITIETKEVDK